MMEPKILPGERVDDLLNGFRLIQRPGSFCFGTDAVLLADFASPRKHERAADLGTGTAIIAVLMAAHQAEMSVDAVEIQPDMAEMAERSICLNRLEDRIRIHQMDMRQAWQKLGQGSKSLVTCNPPYGREHSGPVSRSDNQRISRHEDGLSVDEIVRSAAQLLKFGGRFCVIYPAPRAFEMMSAMEKQHLEPKRIRTIHARAGRTPKLVLIEAVKGAKSGLKWEEPLILYDDEGNPSAEWHRIYRTGQNPQTDA